MPPQPPMLLANGPFNPQQPAMPPNSNPTGHPAPMGMLGNTQNPANRYSLQHTGPMHPGQQPRHLQGPLRPGQNQSLNPGGVPGSHMNNNMGMGINFPGNMVGPSPSGAVNTMRRVASQPSIPNAMGMQMQGMNTNMGMGMGPQNGMQSQIRQQPPMPGQQPPHPLRGPMQADSVPMPMNRPGPSGNPGMNPMNRANTTMPLMNSLNPPQPSNIGHPNMPGGLRNEFPNNIHQPPQHSSSPRPGSHPQNLGMSMGGPGPSQQPMVRRTGTPDMLQPFGGSGTPNFPQGATNRPVNGFPAFGSSSTPPNNMDMSASLPGSLGGTPGSTPNHGGFTLTPAQKLEQMHPGDAYGPSFGMSPQNQNGGQPHPQTHNMNHPHLPSHRPPSQQQHHSSPHPNDISMNIYPPRPQSQPQNNPTVRPSSSHTPRPPSLQPNQQPQHLQQPLPPNNAGMLPTGRPGGPLGPPSSHPAPPPPGIRPSSSAGPPGPAGPSSQQVAPSGPMAPGAPSQQQHQHQQHQQPPIAPRPPGAQQPPHLPQPQPPSQQPPQAGAPSTEPSPHDEASPSSSNTGPGPHTAIGQGPTAVGVNQAPPLFPMPPQRGILPFNPNPAPTAPMSMPHALGHGQGLLRLLQFSGVLANESKQKLQLSWWNELVREYFTPKSVVKFTLWKDNQRAEAKVFEIGVPVLPRFFLVTTQSGVKSMTLTLDGARERLYDYGHAIVECVSAIWTYKFNNGYTVALKGPMTVHVVVTAAAPPGTQAPPVHHPHHQHGGNFYLKFENFEFEARSHEKFIALEAIMGPRSMESPKITRGGRQHPADTLDQQEEERKWEEPRVVIERGFIPGEPVNAFGIPQATMRCLELADSCADMADLIAFSTENELGPKDALRQMSAKIREQMGFPPSHLMNGITNASGHLGNPSGTPTTATFPNTSFPSSTNPMTSPAITLYSSAPTSVTNPNSLVQTPSTMASAMSSPQNAPSSAQNSPRKPHKSIPPPVGQLPGPSGVGNVSLGGVGIGATGPPSSSASTGSAGNVTPSMSSATLGAKRKQITDSPTSTDGSSNKRPQRKRKTGP
uniref:Adhesion defective protein 1 n=2 Tax=Moniliophthora roreri TaxID=221103 RepID=A0A0W0EUP1_MONRR